jgi:hypothetical protein
MFVGTLGLLLLVIGVIIGGYLLYLSASGIKVAGRPMLMAAVLLILFGLQVLVSSFLANQSMDLRRQLIRLERLILERGRQLGRSDNDTSSSGRR